MSKIALVIGDVHSRWQYLNEIIDREHPEVIFQLGDFGVWKGGLKSLQGIIPQDTKIYFCPGNHENWDFLDRYDLGHIHEIMPNVFYCAFGSMLTYRKKNILFCGGADSIDKNLRVRGIDWWPSEIITQKDMDALPNANTKVDIIMSHTAPDYFDLNMPVIDYRDPSTRALGYVYAMFKPKKWYFSHFHKSRKGKFQNCKWFMLNRIEAEGSVMVF